jgi:NADH:ubiquinone oxidoreductase subunit D
MDKDLMRGQKLFKAHCSGCHGIFTKGKESVPNFSRTQIEAYESRLLYDDEANHGIMQKITEGHLLSDIVAIIGSINVVAAELDR